MTNFWNSQVPSPRLRRSSYRLSFESDLSSASSDTFDEPPRKWWSHCCCGLCFKCW
ncbi:hypothetical protein PAXRUDRAFT_422046 [Paxillus rubicundulus Ve08.2h10]|uniref:Uncharacterized protein n=1 Tax=Paxillus rubicundulus Ve08.2h10 TaxID=930991 RepID=A0A0D0DQP3_9AGAM|nr:hypothetical protein PAXRUDRAFT_422046 [Paxillus rubicundulus Ve08.2h10]